jgi:hypothetical protein
MARISPWTPWRGLGGNSSGDVIGGFQRDSCWTSAWRLWHRVGNGYGPTRCLRFRTEVGGINAIHSIRPTADGSATAPSVAIRFTTGFVWTESDGMMDVVSSWRTASFPIPRSRSGYDHVTPDGGTLVGLEGYGRYTRPALS